MKTLIGLFRRNWGLKLLALVLALVIYYSMRDSIGGGRVPKGPWLSKGVQDVGTGK